MAKLRGYQFAAIHRPHEHFAFWGGIAVGKTFTGVHFSIECMELRPDLTGMIGANNHDQLSTVSIREMIYWLDEYGYDYEIDARPPLQPKKFKSYKNILSIRTKRNPKIWTHAFTRIMSAPNPLRGTEFAWYWLDETRDTPENTHDVIISRQREDHSFRRGLITSTTNGEDWSFNRFARARQGQRMYGCMHIPTIKSVEAGIISNEFYSTLRGTYSELLALQELDAQHVNVRGGRAYYSFGPWNEMAKAPWGNLHPAKNAPLIVGCDFNYAPAPCVWMIGQIGPDGRNIHWFGEISGAEKSTPEMTAMLINQYPGFHYRIFGDSSGMRGTTSNAGRHDYAQIAEVMHSARALYTIDAEQANPHVKDRIENMNRMARNSLGETIMTYDPNRCPLFHSDVKVVGWKKMVGFSRSARLDDMGDFNRTHATDAAGYAVFKLFPPSYRTFMPASVPSPLVTEIYDNI